MKEKVLVTGGAGFIGHALIEELLISTDYDIVSLDRLDHAGNLNRLGDLLEKNPQWKERLKVVWHDLKAPFNDFTINKIGQVSHILHLAAASHVDRSILYPLEFVMDNVVGTCNILDYARLHCKNLKLFLYFSTDEVFGAAPMGVMFKEDDRYNAGNPYAATKAGAEQLCVSFENTYSLPMVITHTMNVYGPRQHPEKYIPLIINKILRGEKLQIHANSALTEASKRHYLHSKDIAQAVLFLMSNHKIGEKYNIVGDKEVDNLELALKISKIMGMPLDYELIDPTVTRPRHDFRYSLCGKKMERLGWKQKISLEDGLQQTINWTLKNEKIA